MWLTNNEDNKEFIPTIIETVQLKTIPTVGFCKAKIPSLTQHNFILKVIREKVFGFQRSRMSYLLSPLIYRNVNCRHLIKVFDCFSVCFFLGLNPDYQFFSQYHQYYEEHSSPKDQTNRQNPVSNAHINYNNCSHL